MSVVFAYSSIILLAEIGFVGCRMYWTLYFNTYYNTLEYLIVIGQ